MPRVSGLTDEQWCEFKLMVQKAREDTAGTSAIARSIRMDLDRLEASGCDWAGIVLDFSSDRGLEHVIKAVLKEELGTIAVGWNGHARVVSVPAYYSVRRHDPETGERLKQSELWKWIDLDWDEFESLVRGLTAQADTLSDRATALSQILPLRERFPESKTPGEACELAGIDPRSFIRQKEA